GTTTPGDDGTAGGEAGVAPRPTTKPAAIPAAARRSPTATTGRDGRRTSGFPVQACSTGPAASTSRSPAPAMGPPRLNVRDAGQRPAVRAPATLPSRRRPA